VPSLFKVKMSLRSSSTEAKTEYQLPNAPEDAISAVKFAPNSSQFLIVSSWDRSVSLYDVQSRVLRMRYHHSAPVLDVSFQDAVHSFSGGLDNTLKMYDFNSNTETLIGTHEKPIKVVENCPEVNGVLTGGWDTFVKLWDPRAPHCVAKFMQPDKVYTIGMCGEKFIVGTASRKVFVWDLRNPGCIIQKRESSLKYQTRCIRCFPNKQGFVLSSIEGRVAVEYLDTATEVQEMKYAFKCHRIKEGGIEKIYPVNTVSFHQGFSTFATGGSDGYVNIWDGFNKKRLCQFHRYPTSITSVSFSNDGNVLAIGCSYMYEEEKHPDPLPKNTVYVRKVTDQETRPK